MEASAYPKSSKTETSQGSLILPGLLFFALVFPSTHSAKNPHTPQDLTWTLTNFETGQILRLATGVHPLGTWFPQLKFDLCVLAKDSWGDTERTPGNSYPACRYSEWYVCPGGRRT